MPDMYERTFRRTVARDVPLMHDATTAAEHLGLAVLCAIVMHCSARPAGRGQTCRVIQVLRPPRVPGRRCRSAAPAAAPAGPTRPPPPPARRGRRPRRPDAATAALNRLGRFPGLICNRTPRNRVSNIRLGGDTALIVRGRSDRWDPRVVTSQLLALPSITALSLRASSPAPALPALEMKEIGRTRKRVEESRGNRRLENQYAAICGRKSLVRVVR